VPPHGRERDKKTNGLSRNITSMLTLFKYSVYSVEATDKFGGSSSTPPLAAKPMRYCKVEYRLGIRPYTTPTPLLLVNAFLVFVHCNIL